VRLSYELSLVSLVLACFHQKFLELVNGCHDGARLVLYLNHAHLNKLNIDCKVMGWRDWFRRETEIPAAELEAWLKEKAEERREEQKEQAKAFESKQDESRKSIQSAIEALEAAELNNDKIPIKHKHFMEGNRETFIKVIKNGLESNRLDDLGTKLQRSMTILNEFFQNEVMAVLESVRNFEHARKEQLLLEEANEFEVVLERLAQYQRGKKEKSHVENQRAVLSKEVESIEQQYKDREERATNRLLEKDFLGAQENAEKLGAASKRMRGEIADLFSPLRDVLKKYGHARFHHKQLMDQYLDDASVALSTDIDLEVVDALAYAKGMIGKGEITFKDDGKKQRALDAIDFISKEELTVMLREYALLSKQAKDADRASKEHDAIKISQKLSEEAKKLQEKLADKTKALRRVEDINVEVEYPHELLEKLKVKVV